MTNKIAINKGRGWGKQPKDNEIFVSILNFNQPHALNKISVQGNLAQYNRRPVQQARSKMDT